MKSSAGWAGPALGCGVPVGAFLLTERVAEKSLAPGDHGTTYGGNPFVGAAVDVVLNIMEREDIPGHVREIAPYLEETLDVIRLVPPLIIEKKHVDEMAEKLNAVLRNMQE